MTSKLVLLLILHWDYCCPLPFSVLVFLYLTNGSPRTNFLEFQSPPTMYLSPSVLKKSVNICSFKRCRGGQYTAATCSQSSIDIIAACTCACVTFGIKWCLMCSLIISSCAIWIVGIVYMAALDINNFLISLKVFSNVRCWAITVMVPIRCMELSMFADHQQEWTPYFSV